MTKENENPMIKIESPFATMSIPVSELTNYERNALASLLGFSGARKEAFAELRMKKKFRKIRREELWNKCPRTGSKFDTEVIVTITTDTEKGQAQCQTFLDILPDAEVTSAVHIVSGWCSRCDCEHRMSRSSVLVKLEVSGIPMSSMYAA